MPETRVRPTRDQLWDLYMVQELSHEAIGKLFGWPNQTISKWMKKHGIPGRPRARGSKSPKWCGGVHTDKDGYALRYNPDHPAANSNGYVRENRLVMEKLIGRFLTREEVVHHKDDNRQNNAPENLQLFATNADHLRETLKGKCPKWSEDGRRRILAAVRSRSVPLPPRDELERAYRSEGTTKLAARLGLSASGLVRRMRGLGIQIQPVHRPRTMVLPPVDELKLMLAESGSVAQLAVRLGVTYGGLWSRLKTDGVIQPKPIAAPGSGRRSRSRATSRPQTQPDAPES